MKLFLVLILSSLVGYLNGQNLNVEGFVYDEMDNPLENVSIYIKNSSKGTITNENGKYKFIIEDSKSNELVFSYLGYKTFEINVNSIQENSNFIVNLIPSEYILEEVIISSIPITELFERILEKSKNKIKESAILTSYNREILKADSSYCYFGQSISKYHLKGKGKKLKSKMYVEQNKIVDNKCEEIDKFMKGNPFGYSIKEIVNESFKENRLLKMIFKLEHRYDFTLKTKTDSENRTYNTIEFKPIDEDLSGFRFKGYITYDAESELLLDVHIKKASNKLEDAYVMESFMLFLSAINTEQSFRYRIDGDKYILVYNKAHQKYYIRNIFARTYDKTYSFYNDLTVLDYKEGYFKLDGKNANKKDFLLQIENSYDSNFWENLSITESQEELNFKEFDKKEN